MTAAETPHALVWTDNAHVALVRDVLGRLSEAGVAAVGGPRKGELSELAQTFDAPADDDLRRMLIDKPARFVLLAGSVAVKPDDVQLALQRGLDVFALEPLDHVFTEPAAATGRLIQAPCWRCSSAYLSAADPQQAMGAVESMSITSVGPPDAGSLYARLSDAMDLIVSAFGGLGVPDAIDAALTGPLPEPPDDLRGLTGHMTANLRYADRAAVSLHVSDRAGAWRRTLVGIGRQATLFMDDYHYQLISHQATAANDAAVLDRGGEPVRVVEAAELIAAQIRYMLARPGIRLKSDRRAIAACCNAVLLSCRTSQSESPTKLLQMQA